MYLHDSLKNVITECIEIYSHLIHWIDLMCWKTIGEWGNLEKKLEPLNGVLLQNLSQVIFQGSWNVIWMITIKRKVPLSSFVQLMSFDTEDYILLGFSLAICICGLLHVIWMQSTVIKRIDRISMIWETILGIRFCPIYLMILILKMLMILISSHFIRPFLKIWMKMWDKHVHDVGWQWQLQVLSINCDQQ